MVKPITVSLNGRTQKILSQITRKGETYEQIVNTLVQSPDAQDWKNNQLWDNIPKEQQEKETLQKELKTMRKKKVMLIYTLDQRERVPLTVYQDNRRTQIIKLTVFCFK